MEIQHALGKLKSLFHWYLSHASCISCCFIYEVITVSRELLPGRVECLNGMLSQRIGIVRVQSV